MPERRSTDPILTNLYKTIESIAAQLLTIQEKQMTIYEEIVTMKSNMKTYEDKIEIIDRKLRDLPIHKEGIESMLSFLTDHYDSLKSVIKNFERIEDLKVEGQKQTLNRIIIAAFSGIGFIGTIVITYLISKVKP
jgi:chromosome segregation ATPase